MSAGSRAAGWLLAASLTSGAHAALAGPAEILERGVEPFACLDPPVTAAAGIPFANLCETLDFTPLDNPIDEGAPNSILIQTRAGAFNPSAAIAEAQLIAARPSLHLVIPEHSFSELADRTRFPKLPGIVFSGGSSLYGLNGIARGLEAQAARAEADPLFLARHGLRRAPAGADPAALREAARQLLFEFETVPGDPTSPTQTFDSFFPRLLEARIDRDRSLDLALPAFMTRTAADHVSEFGAEIANRARLSGPTVRETVPGLGSGNVSSYCRFVDPAAPTLLCADPQDFTFGNNENRLIPSFLGPDGRRDTPDDLPIAKGPDPLHPTFLTQDDQVQLLLLKRFPAFGATQDLIPSVPFGASDVVELVAAGSDGQLGTADDVCRGHSFNADGVCILLMASSSSVIDPGALAALGDPFLRPSSAATEPADLTDLVGRGTGVTLPARPPSPTGRWASRAASRTARIRGGSIRARAPWCEPPVRSPV